MLSSGWLDLPTPATNPVVLRCVSCPVSHAQFDVVKSRMQNQLPGQASKYNWTFPSLGVVAREEGFKALYKASPGLCSAAGCTAG